MPRFTVAILGATGAVGRQMLEVLDERAFPIETLVPLASERSVGEKVMLGKREWAVKLAEPSAFEGVDIVLASAGGSVSKALLPAAVKAGAVCIDNSSAFRMDPAVPLVVPEVNAGDVAAHQGIIANPNCSTIQLVVALQPLHAAFGLEEVTVSTYQSVSGAGQKGMEELSAQSMALFNQRPFDIEVHPARIAFNLVPHIGPFDDVGYTQEEMKLVHESRKIMKLPGLLVSPTAVRVPVFAGHAESVRCRFKQPVDPTEARAVLRAAPGVKVVDAPQRGRYPMPIDVVDRDEVFVGRIRRDLIDDHGLNLWIVADNLRKGAATNAVQIAEIVAGNAS